MSAWSMYEPMDSVNPAAQMPQQVQMQQPQVQYKSAHAAPMPQPHQLAAQKGEAQYPAHTKNVQVPAAQPSPSSSTGAEDISDYYEVNDWGYYLVAAILIEVVVIGITRFFPSFSGKYLNLWYSRFKLSAVIADVASVLIGFGIARYIFTEVVYPKTDWNPWYFTGTAIAVQIIHDILFYIGVIRPLPEGKNGLIDVFKPYAEVGGAKLIAGDSVIMAGTSLATMLLKAAPIHAVVIVGLISAYTIPFILETKNEFSALS